MSRYECPNPNCKSVYLASNTPICNKCCIAMIPAEMSVKDLSPPAPQGEGPTAPTTRDDELLRDDIRMVENQITPYSRQIPATGESWKRLKARLAPAPSTPKDGGKE